MEDKVILLSLFSNNVLRANLVGYEGYVCETDIACNLLKTSSKYFKDKNKALKLTFNDFDALFSAEYSADSDELKLWNKVKEQDIDIESIEPAVIKRIKTQIKDYFFAEAFDEDNYDRDKLEELYVILSKLDNLQVDDEVVEDLSLDNIDDCVDIYTSGNKDGIPFFDERISNTLSSKAFDYGTINVITAPPGNGKTAIILNQGIYAASLGKHVMHLAIGDLTKKQLMIRILAIITQKPMSSIMMLNPTQFKEYLGKAKEKYADIFKYFHAKTILPNTMSGIELIKLIESEQDRLGIKFDQVAVDYDGNIETDASGNSGKKIDKEKLMYYQQADVYNLFTSFAKRNETVVWMLSQPKIQYWSNEKIPLEGLNDSSKKQHIVDFIMSLGRKVQDEDQITFFISKNRHGENNKTLYSSFDGASQVFEPITSWSS